MSSDIDFVLENLRETAEELHLLFENEKVVIDRELYQRVDMFLRVTEGNIELLLKEYEQRIEQRKNFYAENSGPTIP